MAGPVCRCQALGVNYRTMINCYDSRQVSRRMRQALTYFCDEGVVDGSGEAGDESLEQRVAVLEEENP